MNVNMWQLLKNVQNLDDYRNITLKIINKLLNSSFIQFNAPAIKALKKCMTIEVEYFVKYEENGAIIKILQFLIELPPSRNWSYYGKEVIYVIHHWIEEIRKQLIFRNINWWTFLKVLMNFIQEINLKSNTLNEILIQETAECLLNLATLSELNLKQKYQVVTCFNDICKHTSINVRLAWKEMLDKYLIKLSTIMASCGDISTQFVIMETLIRWLTNRQDPAVRREAIDKWFPTPLYSEEAVNVFLNTSWQYFYKDARDFLHAHNKSSDAVISLYIKRFALGSLILIDGTRNQFLDINSGSKSITLMLNSRQKEIIGENCLSKCHTLTISEENTTKIQMLVRTTSLIMTITIVDPLKMYPSEILKDRTFLTIEVIHENKAAQLDKALRNIFGTKYEEFKVGHRAKLSISKTSQENMLTGYVISSKTSASSSSLAMLKDNLINFTKYPFEHKMTSIQALPMLSTVTEVSEQKSERESNQLKNSHCCLQKVHKNGGTQILNNNENSICSIWSSTIDTADDIALNNAFESLASEQRVEIIDILAQEALKSQHNKSADIIEDTNDERALIITKKSLCKKQTALSSTTTVEPNSQAVHVQKVVESSDKDKYMEKNTFDADVVDLFFSQHLRENKSDGGITISPTLARKINKTSSESSDGFNMNDCLDNINIEVCCSPEKFPEYQNKNNQVTEIALQNTSKLDIDNQKKGRTKKSFDTLKVNEFITQNNIEQKKQVSIKAKKQLRRKREKKRMGTARRESSEIENNVYDGPITKKRKLYSLKDDGKAAEVRIPETDDNTVQSTTEVYGAVSNSNVPNKDTGSRRWKSFQNEHNKSNKPALIPTRTIIQIFDSLKENIDGRKIITRKDRNTCNNDNSIYDVFSDSDFERKTIYGGRKMSNSNAKKNTNGKRKNTRQYKNKTLCKKQKQNIIDERVRNAREQLNTSLIVEEKNNDICEPAVVLNTKPSIVPIYSKEPKKVRCKRTKTNNSTLEISEKNNSENVCLNNSGAFNKNEDAECILSNISKSRHTPNSSKFIDSPEVTEKQHSMVLVYNVNTKQVNKNIATEATKKADLEKRDSCKHSLHNEHYRSARVLVQRLSDEDMTRLLRPESKKLETFNLQIKKPEVTKDALIHESICNKNVSESRFVEIEPSHNININDSPINQKNPDPVRHSQDKEDPRSLRVSIERLSAKELSKSLSPNKNNTNLQKSPNKTQLETPIENLSPNSNKNLHCHTPNKSLNQQNSSQRFNTLSQGAKRGKEKSINPVNVERSVPVSNISMEIQVENIARSKISDWFERNDKENQKKSIDQILLEIFRSFDTRTAEIRTISNERSTESFQNMISRLENLVKDCHEQTEKIHQEYYSLLQSVNDRFKKRQAEIVADFKKENDVQLVSDERKMRLNVVLHTEDLKAVEDYLKRQK